MPASKSYISLFVRRLYDMLKKPELVSVISWDEDGVYFQVNDLLRFEEQVLPQFFKHRKVNSFIRQLYMYGFSKTRRDSSYIIFNHENFRRGRQELLPLIRRKVAHGRNRSECITRAYTSVAYLHSHDTKHSEEYLSSEKSHSSRAVCISPMPVGVSYPTSFDNHSFSFLLYRGSHFYNKLVMSRSIILDNNYEQEQSRKDDDVSSIDGELLSIPPCSSVCEYQE